MKHTMRALASALAVAGLLLGGTAAASAEGFTVTATPNTGVKAGDIITVTTTGLTGTVGVYASLCKAAAPGVAPTLCDPEQSHMAWITGTGAPGSSKDSGTISAVASFTASGTAVNCLVDACVVYVRGDHNNRTDYSLIRTVAIGFVAGTAAPVKKADVATALLNGIEIKANVPGQLQYRTPVELVVRAASGLPVTLQSLTPECSVNGTKVEALTGKGTCAIAATTAGNDSYAPFTAAVNFPFYLNPGYQQITSTFATQKVAIGKPVTVAKATFASNMGEDVKLASSTPQRCTVKATASGWTISGVKTGVCKLVASAAAVADKFTAASVGAQLTVTKKTK